jgi:hypothetical protein
MGCIKIDKKLQKSEEIADFFAFLLFEARNVLPRLSIPKILLAKLRPGLDSGILATSIISRFNEIGIPNGALENGNPNVMEAFVKVLSEEFVDAIQSDMRVDTAVDIGMVVASAGANASGPVASTGANPAPHTATGIAQ